MAVKRILIVLAVITGAVLAIAATPVRAATPFRVVAVGDSICTHVCPSIIAPDFHFDAEPGRAPYDVGAENRASTVEALGVLTRLVANSSTNWIVVFDGATGTQTGRYIDNAEWGRYLGDVLRLTAGKCLIFVTPAYAPSNATGYSVSYARTVAWLDLAAANSHRCIRTVNWFAAVAANPSLVGVDGLHPSAAGVAWLAGQINSILPDA